MNASRFSVAFAVVALAGAARAQSFIPSNYVDDFGPVTSDSSVTSERVAPRAYRSLIVANYVDDFGVDSTYVEDFGTEPTQAAPDQLAHSRQAAD